MSGRPRCLVLRFRTPPGESKRRVAPPPVVDENQIQAAKAKRGCQLVEPTEIGVGLNPKVANLTGSMLFDEKAPARPTSPWQQHFMAPGDVGDPLRRVTHGATMRVDGVTGESKRGQLSSALSNWQENHAPGPARSSRWRRQPRWPLGRPGGGIGADYRLQRLAPSEPAGCRLPRRRRCHGLAGQFDLQPAPPKRLVRPRRAGCRAKLDRKVAQHVRHVMWV